MRECRAAYLALMVCCGLVAPYARAGEADALGRLHSLQKIRDAAAVAKECRALLATRLGPGQVVEVVGALVHATSGDGRIEVLRKLPANFPEAAGLDLFVFAIRDSKAHRSLDLYRLMLGRYGEKVTADRVDEAARPLLNERRNWLRGAEEVAEAALERFPDNGKLLDILAEVYRRTRRGDQSLALQRKAVEKASSPEVKKLMYDRLARNLRLQGKEAEALEVRYEVVREWPDRDWARQALDGLAAKRLRSRGTDEAAKVYAWYIATYPKGKWVEHCHTRVPGLYQLDGQYDAAAAQMRRIRPLVGERAQWLIDRDLKGMPSVAGRVVDEAGAPVGGATVALARRSPLREERGRLIVARTRCDKEGRFELRNLPWHTRYEFLAATKPDEPPTGLSTTFGPKGFVLELNDRKALDIRFGRQPLATLPEPPVPQAEFGDGIPRRHLRTFVLREWTGSPWPRSPVHYAIELPAGVKAASLRLVGMCGRPVPFQYTASAAMEGTLTFFTGLGAHSSAAFFLFGCDRETAAPAAAPGITVEKAGANVVVVSTGVASFRVPVGPPRALPPSLHISAAPAPVLAVRGPDGIWRGEGCFIGRGQVTRIASEWLEEGPLVRRLRLRYEFDREDAFYEATLTFLASQPHVAVHEKCTGGSGEFRFRVGPGFGPDRAALCWINKLHVEAIACTKRRRLIQMPRYVMWAPPGEGDAAGFYRDEPASRDLISCFAIHPGDWVVQAMERWRARVLGDRSRYNGDPRAGGREAIDCFEDKADAYFSCHFFAGERRWGLAVTDRANAVHAIANLRTRVGEFPLDWYKDLVLDWDEAPLATHPRLAVARERLPQVARGLASSRVLQDVVTPRRVQWFQKILTERPTAAMDFLLTGEPERGWQARDCAPDPRILAGIAAGKARANIWSPVGVRCSAYNCADAYDALANSNVHGEWALRELRAKLMLVAYGLSGGDFMAWRYHAGHRNFDFSRLDVVTACALCFPGHPHAGRLIEQARTQFKESLAAFTTPVSGKWQENLGCYYLWSLRTSAAMNARLVNAGGPGCDPFASPMYPLFLRFATRTVTPAHPFDDNLCIDGLAEGQAYADVAKGRRHPGVGDHGGNGGHRVYDGLALAGSLAHRLGHTALAADLVGAWNAGGREATSKAGIDLKGMIAANMDARFAESAAMRPLASEHLPAYGFCFRSGWGTPEETYLLFKCGTGGYRYHFSEGSFVLYAGNRPLSVDGDENFIPARHATISLGPKHAYVGNGRVERHFVHPAAAYCRGVFADSHVARTILFARNDYFVIRDDAEGETNFILPLLVRSIERRGDHYFCPGRLGLDVRLHPLGPEPAKVQIATDPLLNQQRITMTRTNGADHLNVIAWAKPGGNALRITAFGPGYRIQGEGVDDIVFLTAEPVTFAQGEMAFEGRAGLIRLGGGEPRLLLLDGKSLRWGEHQVASPDGAPVAK